MKTKTNISYELSDQTCIALILGCIAKVKWSDNWVAFGETLLQVVMLQSAECNHSLHLPVAIQKIIINPMEHQDETQGMLISYVCDLLASQTERVVLCSDKFQVQPIFLLFYVDVELGLSYYSLNPLNAELNPPRHLLELVGATIFSMLAG